jgi:DNA-binding transcriptional regulator YdaS (Cro superfamily)
MARPTTRKKHPGVAKAIGHAGSQTSLANLLGCKQSAISKRLYKRVDITAEWAVACERACKGAVSRKDLRPDLW